MGKFQPRELREGTSLDEIRRTLNEVQKAIAVDVSALSAGPRVTPLILDGPYAAGYGQVVRVAPPSGGLRVILPPKSLEQPAARVVVVVEGSAGALSVEAVDATVNGSDTLTFLAGIGTAEFQLTPTGWYGFSASLVTVPLGSLPSQAADSFLGRLAGAGTPAVQALADIDSTSIVYDATSHTLQRAALTGEATAAQNVNALTVTRSTDFSTSPWTGNHKFGGQLLFGGEQTDAGTGAVNVTLGDVVRLRFTSAAGNITLGTVSGCAEGRVLIVEYSGTGTHTITHSAAGVNAFSCPGDVNLVIAGRGGFVAVGRNATANWKVIATTN